MTGPFRPICAVLVFLAALLGGCSGTPENPQQQDDEIVTASATATQTTSQPPAQAPSAAPPVDEKPEIPNGTVLAIMEHPGAFGLRFEVAAPADCWLEMSATGPIPPFGPSALLLIDNPAAPSYAFVGSGKAAQAFGMDLARGGNVEGAWWTLLGGPVNPSGAQAYFLVVLNGIAPTPEGRPGLMLNSTCPDAKLTRLEWGPEATLAGIGELASGASSSVWPAPDVALAGSLEWADTLAQTHTRLLASYDPADSMVLRFAANGSETQWSPTIEGESLFIYDGPPGTKKAELFTASRASPVLASFAGCEVAAPSALFELPPCAM